MLADVPVADPPSRPLDHEHCYRIASSRDGRFDGTFVVAVTTTGIYCRPSCPAVTPRRSNVRFYLTPAAAQGDGFRACKRCRPDAAPGSPEWDIRADAVARAVRLIGDGMVGREGVGGLARRVGYSPRHLTRLLNAELGTGPLRLAMAYRTQTARALLEGTDLPVTEVAWASGFNSIRQFNDVIRRVYAQTPGELRRRSAPAPGPDPAPGAMAGPGPGRPGGPGPAVVHARLAYRPPLDAAALLGFLGARAVPGVESYDGSAYTTALRLPGGLGSASISVPTRAGTSPTPWLDCELRLDDIADYATAVARLRRLLDLDADPEAVRASLSGDPVLAPLVAASPGRRMPGTHDAHELALRAVVGQQVSLAAARAAGGRLADRFGEPLRWPHAGVVRAFPTARALAGADPEDLPLPRTRATSLVRLATAMAQGELELHPGVDRQAAHDALLSRPGIGPWTAAYIRMRALGDPDVMPPGDAAVRRALTAAGTPPPGPDRSPPARAADRRWSPWRSYATAHLWAAAARPGPAAEKGPDT